MSATHDDWLVTIQSQLDSQRKRWSVELHPISLSSTQRVYLLIALTHGCTCENKMNLIPNKIYRYFGAHYHFFKDWISLLCMYEVCHRTYSVVGVGEASWSFDTRTQLWILRVGWSCRSGTEATRIAHWTRSLRRPSGIPCRKTGSSHYRTWAKIHTGRRGSPNSRNRNRLKVRCGSRPGNPKKWFCLPPGLRKKRSWGQGLGK